MKQSLSDKKGQLFTTDMMIAIVLVSLMLSLVILFWFLGSNEINKRKERTDMQRAALDTSNYLIRLKLVNKTNIFDTSKLYNLTDCTYSDAQSDFGLSGYEFYLNFTYVNNTSVMINNRAVACGRGFENSSDAIWVRRIGIYEGNEVIMRLTLWK